MTVAVWVLVTVTVLETQLGVSRASNWWWACGPSALTTLVVLYNHLCS